LKCFVITKKHIAAVISVAAVLIISFTVQKIKPPPATVTAFNNIEPEKIFSQTLPSPSEKNLKEKIHNALDKIKEINPSDIVRRHSPAFRKEKPSETPTPTSAVSSPPMQPSPTPTPSPVEEKNSASSGVEIKNETSYEITASDYSNEPLEIKKNSIVLIMHTHTTESYASEESGRSIDDTKNMIAIGGIFEQILSEAGIRVIHDKTVHDYPSYQGAYSRSLKTIRNQIEQNPDIGIVLDIHRDAIVKSDGTKVKLTADIGEKKAAQMMFVCGTNDSGLSHTNWQSNLNFALKIQEQANEDYPGLMRDINLRKERFNQHMTPGSLIIETGTHGNTLDEAKTGAEMIAKSIAKVLGSNS